MSFDATHATPFTSRDVAKVVTNRATSDGDGVTVLRSIGQSPRYFSPFALLDYAIMEAGSKTKGTGFPPHPHRGISTLTYILPHTKGSVKHHDHKGNKGIIGPGDIQYMSAGKGIVHSEMPYDDNECHIIQLWINLRKEDKMSEPDYQEYTSSQLPIVERDGVWAKVIMGSALDTHAKVNTKTPVHYIHYKLEPNTTLNHPLPPHWNTFLVSLHGSGIAGNNNEKLHQRQTIFFNHGIGHAEAELQALNNKNDPTQEIDPNHGVSVTAGDNGLEFVLISGEPLTDGAEVVQHGPMIMNSQKEIYQAFMDYREGKNGFEGAREFDANWKP
jgi:redox-sensitive bicupin YhaK (pirin superfamily)